MAAAAAAAGGGGGFPSGGTGGGGGGGGVFGWCHDMLGYMLGDMLGGGSGGGSGGGGGGGGERGVNLSLLLVGRGSHSFPFPPNLSLRCPFPLNLSTQSTRGCVPKVLMLSSNGSDVFPKVLKLSFEVSECKPLLEGHVALTVAAYLWKRSEAGRRVTRYPILIWEMTISILSSPISLAHIPCRYPG